MRSTSVHCVVGLLLLLLLLLAAAADAKRNSSAMSNVKRRLLRDLFADYSTQLRLAYEPTVVTLDPALYSIIDVEEARESMVIAQWFEVAWQDVELQWDPSEYSGIESVRLATSLAWMPDLTIYEMLERTITDRQSSFLTLYSDGTVFVSRTEQLTIHCSLDVRFFPDDIQSCNVTYVTWAYPSSEIVLKARHAPRARDQHFQSSTGLEWTLLNYSCDVQLVFYGETHGSWWEITYTIGIQRKPMYYIITLTVPSFLITSLALIGVFTPSNQSNQRAEKVSIGLTALLTMAVILMIVSDLMPKNASSFPKLGTFILFEIIIMATSTVMSVLVMILHSRSRLLTPVPKPLMRLFMPGIDMDRYPRSPAELATPRHSQPVTTSATVVFSEKQDDWLGQVSIQSKIFITLRQILLKQREAEAHMRHIKDEKKFRRKLDTDWANLCYRIDVACLVLSLSINCTVMYIFSY